MTQKPLDWGFNYERTDWRTENNERIWNYVFMAILPDLSIQEVHITFASKRPIKTAQGIAKQAATADDILAYHNKIVEIDSSDGLPTIYGDR